MSHATLSRVERGFLPDLETFSKLCKWLGVDAGEVLRIKPPTASEPPAASVHFRKDETISPKTAAALAHLILAAQRAMRAHDRPRA